MHVKVKTDAILKLVVAGLAGLLSLVPLARQQLLASDEPRIIAESLPLDDAVLSQAPGNLDLSFPGRVRLVKLALYNEKRDWVDINFRYDPRPDTHFSWPVPRLDQAVFYTAEWAVLDGNEQLLRGSFSFAFGPGAEPPSAVRERLRLLLELQDDMPLLQELERLGLDPAEIIINDQTAPAFEPPFAPILN